MKRSLWSILFIIFSYNLSIAVPVIYQAENGVLNGTVISTTLSGYQGTGYVTDWNNDGDSCVVACEGRRV